MENDNQKQKIRIEELESCIAGLEIRVNDIPTLKGELRKYKSDYEELKLENEKLIGKLENYKNEVSEKDLSIGVLRSDVAKLNRQNEEIYYLENLIKEKEIEISDKNYLITEKNHKLEQLTSKLNEIESYHTQMDMNLGEKMIVAENQISSLNKILEMKNKEIQGLELKLKDEDGFKKKLKNLEEKNALIIVENDKLKVQKEKLNKDLQDNKHIYTEISKLRSEIQDKNIDITS